MFYIIFFLISSFWFTKPEKAAFAKTPENIIYEYRQIPPTINYYPYSDFAFDDPRIEWMTYNNLRRNEGSAFYGTGEQLFIEGYVRDINNVPIDNVTVKLVQANSNGVYNHMVKKSDALYDANFSSNGISITDNRGYYKFITVFPGYYNRRAPHLHVRFESAKHGVIETEIFFENHPRNEGDPKYYRLTAAEKKLVTAQVFFINPREKELGKRARFDVIYNANQTTKEL